jgi:hypothetical protein
MCFISSLYLLIIFVIVHCFGSGRQRHRWIDNIKMDLLEIRLGVVNWIGLAQDRYRWRALVNSVMNLQVP